MISIFGDDIPDEPARVRQDRAHPAPPGSGPDGRTCKTCKHRRLQKTRAGSKFFKCFLMRRLWTFGAATDIRCRDKACRHYQESHETEIPLA